MDMQRSIHIIMIVIFTIFVLVGCSKNNSTTIKKENPQEFKPVTHTITAPKAGRVIGLIAEKGERISKDQPLFAIADEELSQQFAKATTEIAKEEAKFKIMQTGIPESSDANLPALQAKVETAQQKASKMNSLLTIGGVSRRQAEQAQEELLLAQQALNSAKQQSLASKPASPEELAEQEKKIAALKEAKNKIEVKLQQNEVLCPATAVVKDVLVQNNTSVSTNKPILILETTKE